ncbi:MAG: PH domain-containing protein [Elusimicrobiales bacterium]
MAGEKNVFSASRWTAGNFLFPTRIEITHDRVARIKPGLLSLEEESISMAKVASVNIKSGLLWADIRIDSSGGTNPIVSHGHHKADAQAIRALIERYQHEPA